jgi:hypothetical protein
MDRYAIMLKKKPGKDGFSKRLREIFGTKYPIKLIAVLSVAPIKSFYENYLFYEVKNEMFVFDSKATANVRLDFFPLNLHGEKLKAAFKAVESHYHFKCVHISRWGTSEYITIELPIDDKRNKGMAENFNQTFGKTIGW